MAPKFKNVAEVVASLVDDKEFSTALQTRLEKKSLAKQLAAIRCSKGVTQEELAKQIGCTQSRISKIENANNDQLAVQDIFDYSKALAVALTLNFGEPMGAAVDMVKYHALKIKNHLDQLAALAGNDNKIKQGVADFYMEAMVNLLSICLGSARKLEPEPKKMLSLLRMFPHMSLAEISVQPDSADSMSKGKLQHA